MTGLLNPKPSDIIGHFFFFGMILVVVRIYILIRRVHEIFHPSAVTSSFVFLHKCFFVSG